MSTLTLSHEAGILAQSAQRISTAADYDPLIELAGEAQFVLIGEASHGTHDFYAPRAELTRRLIDEKGFRIVALEADWPDMLRVHRYVTGRANERGAAEALGDFRRFPAWMWRNTVMVEFVNLLRGWNLHPDRKNDRAGIFGMDLYSMHASMESVLGYLDKVDSEAARRARRRYSCFEHFGEDPQAYGYATTRGHSEPCEDEVVAQLIELRRKYGEFMSRDGQVAKDEFFYAEQNARLVTNAERYYRSMFHGREESWNLRDKHMTETLAALIGHFDSGRSKVIVWAHNSHLGDARAANAMWASSRANASASASSGSASALIPAPSLRRATGEIPPNAAASGQAFRGATKNFFMRPKCRDSGSICAKPTPRRNCSANAGFSARSGLFTSQKPSGGAITLRPACRNNSTR